MASGPQLIYGIAKPRGRVRQVVGELLRALARETGWAGGSLDGLRGSRTDGVAATRLLLGGLLGRVLLGCVLLGHAPSLSSPPVPHLRPTADLAERAILPDDPGQALALTRVLFSATPLMLNHHRGLWGYTGTAIDGAPLSVQSTGIGGPSAAIVVTELADLGLRRAVRIGRAWALDTGLRAGDLVAATTVIAGDGTSRTLGAPATLYPNAALAGALESDHAGVLASADVPEPDPAWEALAFDLESAAVLAAAARAGVPAASVVAIEGPVDHEHVAERLGRAALAALAPVPAPH
jgi:uridine phosphorylase